MFRPLRRIRQQFLTDGKFSKYMTYAIGETLLLVVGILIALQINTWNEQRKENDLEQSYYCKLQEDVKQDISQIYKQIDHTGDRLLAANEMLRLLQMDNPSIEEVLKQNLGAISLITYTFRPSLATYQDLNKIQCSSEGLTMRSSSFQHPFASVEREQSLPF
jgi:hypothetical protein